ncbi:MAG: energy transducer TonB [Candidatus Acidiferrum sp.]
MRINHSLKFTVTLLVISLFVPGSVRPQEKSVPAQSEPVPASVYANSAEGLRQLLQDVRAAARSRDNRKVTTFLKGMEIPDCEVWLHKMYEPDKADSWMGLCDAKILGSSEKSMQELFTALAKEEGEISTRKVNDNPEPGKGMEWGWLQAIRQPLDIYFANWKPSNRPKESKGEPIGYFIFIDGGFRWESSIRFFKPKTSTAKFVPPKLIKKVDPVYATEAASQHIVGTVRVYYVIGGDGAVYNAHAISGEGLSNDPSLRKAAEEAVIQWRYQPATLDGKPIQTNAVTVDIVFSPKG